MSPCSRRHALRGGLVAATAGLAGCVFTGDEVEPHGERTLHESNVDLDPTASWPSYGRDARNAGHDPDASGPTGDATVAWRYTEETEAGSGVVVDGGRVYAAGVVLDGETGRRVGGEWRGHTSTPAVAGGTTFVPTFDLEARDAATGELDWTFDPELQGGGLPGVTVADGSVYAPGKSRRLLVYAVDTETGEEEWRWNPDPDAVGGIGTPPAVADGTVYVNDSDGTVYALDGETGEEAWRRATGVSTTYSSPVVVDGTVYLGSRDGDAIALRAEDGEPRWRTALGHEVWATVAVTPDAVFATGTGGSVTRLAAADGTIDWQRRVEDAGRLGSPTVADGTVYVGSETDGTVVALAAADGTEDWRVETRSVLFGDYTREGVVDGPAVVDGVVYVATEPGDVHAIRES